MFRRTSVGFLVHLSTAPGGVGTRNKIQLGGLVAKAGLDEEEPAVILGALLEVADNLSGPNAIAIRRRYRRRGDAAFREDQSA